MPFFGLSVVALWLLNGVAMAADAVFVGADACKACHEAESVAWGQSHHHDAMLPATDASVRGNFDNASFEHDGVTTQFLRRNNQFIIRTPSEQGVIKDYKVHYTFGITPLQQYIIEPTPGRLQMFTIAWDTRSLDEGGQRWFDLYPNEALRPGDSLHWTGIDQNWNHLCADCHSTNVKKNYTAATRKFATTWSDVNVGCESCHGPGSVHANLMEQNKALSTPAPMIDNAGFEQPLSHAKSLNGCSSCHSRRTVLSDGQGANEGYLDRHFPVLLSSDLYHPDGQVKDEVFVYGSFLQSKKHQAGVVCNNCHEPHTQALRAPGDQMCFACHTESTYATASHHHHPVESTGARCVGCHMPTTTFMRIDARRDHRFASPQPGLSARLDSPDACTQCHNDQTVDWAAQHTKRWYTPTEEAADSQPALAITLHGVRQGDSGLAPRLATQALNQSQPTIWRATAASELQRYPGPNAVSVLAELLKDESALVRMGAVEGLQNAEPAQRRALLMPLLKDQVTAVRHAATRALSFLRPSQLNPNEAPIVQRALDDYLAVLNRDLDRPEVALLLARFHIEQGEATWAREIYQQTLDQHPSFAPAYVNLADLLRELGENQRSTKVLEKGALQLTDDPDIHHALGLAHVREKDLTKAVGALGRAAALAVESSHYQYVYALVLDATGDVRRAMTAMEDAHARDKADVDVLVALVKWHERAGDTASAERYRALLPAQ